MTDDGDVYLLAACGGLIGWIGLWSFVGKVVKEFNRNAPPGSRAKKVQDTITFIQVLPFLPLVPIFVIWTLGVKRPMQRWSVRRRGKREVVKLRRRWEGVRKEWAMSDLETARSEKPRIQADHVLEEDIGPEAPAEQVAVAPPGKSLFESLPAELRMEVYSYLDYGIALRVSGVSRFIRNDKPHESIDQEQRATFVYHADTFQHNRRAGRLACYSCLRLRNKDEFSEDFRTGDFKRFGVQESERRCFDCQVVRNEVTWGRILGRRMGRWETRTWNRLVGLVKRRPTG